MGLLSFPECFPVAEPVNLVAIRRLIFKAALLQPPALFLEGLYPLTCS